MRASAAAAFSARRGSSTEQLSPGFRGVFLTPRDAQPFTLWSENLKPSDFKWKITPSADGYTTELEGPANDLPFGFAVKINDAENGKGKAVRSAAWAGSETHKNRFGFGVIRKPGKETKAGLRRVTFSEARGNGERRGVGEQFNRIGLPRFARTADARIRRA